MSTETTPTQKVVYVANRSVSPAFLLTMVFLALKLTGYVDWAWYWVFAPMWVPFVAAWGFVLGSMTIVAVMALVAGLVALWLDRK
jgi:hypothetical protein